MKNALGVGINTSYVAMCWLMGTLAVKYRIWKRAFVFYNEACAAKGLEAEALEVQWQIWERMTIAVANLGKDDELWNVRTVTIPETTGVDRRYAPGAAGNWTGT